MVIDNMISCCIQLIFKDDKQLQTLACFVICNAICEGNPNQILAIINTTDSIRAICKLLRNGENKILLSIIIKALDRCMSLGDTLQNQQQAADSMVKALLHECGCLNALKRLKIIDDGLRNLVDSFIARYFDDVVIDDNVVDDDDNNDNNNDVDESTPSNTVRIIYRRYSQLH